MDTNFKDEKTINKMMKLLWALPGYLLSAGLLFSKGTFFKISGIVCLAIFVGLTIWWIVACIIHNKNLKKDKNYMTPLILPSFEYDSQGSSGHTEIHKNICRHTVKFKNVGSTFEILDRVKHGEMTVKFSPERIVSKGIAGTMFIDNLTDIHRKDISFELSIKDENGKAGKVLCTYHNGQNHVSFARI